MKSSYFPDYKNSILALSSSLLKKYGISAHHPSLIQLDKELASYKNVVLLIFDGMGINVLNQYKNDTPFLHQKLFQTISSVYPPTTTAATTSIHSGLAPIEHGWIGWMQYFKEYDKVIELFRDTDFYEQEKINTNVWKDFLDYEDIYTQIKKANPSIEFTKIFPSWYPNGVKSISQMRKKIIYALKNHPKNLILGYWSNPDSTIHKKGLNTPTVLSIMQDINTEMQKLADQIDKETLVIITADHGIIDTEEIFINEIAGFDECFKNPPAMEARSVSFFIKENKKNQFLTLFNRYFKEDFLLFTHDEYINSGLLGTGKKHKKIDDFVGDYVAVSHGKRALCYYTKKEKAIRLMADHAGITKEEMEVPLILLNK